MAQQPCRPGVAIGHRRHAAGHELERLVGGVTGEHEDQPDVAAAVEVGDLVQVLEHPPVDQHVGHAELAGVPVLAGADDLDPGAVGGLDPSQGRQAEAEGVARARRATVEEDAHRAVGGAALRGVVALGVHRRAERHRAIAQRAIGVRQAGGVDDPGHAEASRLLEQGGGRAGGIEVGLVVLHEEELCLRAAEAHEREDARPRGGDRRVARGGRLARDRDLRARQRGERACDLGGDVAAGRRVGAVVDVEATVHAMLAREVVGEAQHGVDAAAGGEVEPRQEPQDRADLELVARLVGAEHFGVGGELGRLEVRVARQRQAVGGRERGVGVGEVAPAPARPQVRVRRLARPPPHDVRHVAQPPAAHPPHVGVSSPGARIAQVVSARVRFGL